MTYKVNEFDQQVNKPKALSDVLSGYKIKKSEHEHEFQEVCSNLQKDFGKLVWTLPYKAGVTPHKMLEASKIAQQRGILKFPYLLGIIKKL